MKTYAEIWSTLSQIDCGDKVDIINTNNSGPGLKYISWANAWGILMKHFPEATYTFYDNTYEENGTVMVHCSIQIGECGRTMWLPVMSFNNKSIQNPTSKDINDAKMRCFVKCMAMFGLANYLYIKDGLPSVNDSPIVTEASAPQSESLSVGEHILYNDTLTIPCGNGKGKSYEGVYNDDLVQVDKHIKYHSNSNNPNTNKVHLAQLMAYKRAIQTEPSNGVA